MPTLLDILRKLGLGKAITSSLVMVIQQVVYNTNRLEGNFLALI